MKKTYLTIKKKSGKRVICIMILIFIITYTLAPRLTPNVMAGFYGDTIGHEHERAIDDFYRWGLLSESSSEKFRPDDYITRMELAEIISKFSLAATVKKTSAIAEWDLITIDVVKNAVMSGAMYLYSDGTFRPDRNITRNEAFNMFSLFLPETDTSAVKLTFTDSDSVTGYGEDALKTLVKYGVVRAYSDGTIRPYAFITRGEVVSIFRNIRLLNGATAFKTGSINTGSTGTTGYVPIYRPYFNALESVSTSQDAERGTVYGRVTLGGTSLGMNGVRVYYTYKSKTYEAYTDTSGYYELTDLPYATYTMYAYIAGYATASKKVTISNREIKTVDFTLTKTNQSNEKGILYGKVYDGNTGSRVSGATVTAVSARGTYAAITNNVGEYNFDNLTVDDYTITASHPLYYSDADQVVVTDAEDAVMDFVLHPLEMATLTGVVYEAADDMNEKTLDGVLISTVYNGITYSTVTSNGGKFSLMVPVDTISVSVSKSGYVTEVDEVSVDIGTVSYNISLNKSN